MLATEAPLELPTSGWHRKERLARCCVLIFMLVAAALCTGAQPSPDTAVLATPPTDVIHRMVQQNQLRSERLKYFTAQRHYHLEVHDLGRLIVADLHAKVTYTPTTGKRFQVTDKSGSHLLLNKVLLKLLETEQGDPQQKKNSLTPENYEFAFQSQTAENGQTLYVFAVEPKMKNRLLYRGRIWIDAKDYALVRVEAQPAENPSFWIRNTEIHHTYSKNGEFWLPQSNRSESKIRFGGTAVLTIDYGTYDFDQQLNVDPLASH